MCAPCNFYRCTFRANIFGLLSTVLRKHVQSFPVELLFGTTSDYRVHGALHRQNMQLEVTGVVESARSSSPLPPLQVAKDLVVEG